MNDLRLFKLYYIFLIIYTPSIMWRYQQNAVTKSFSAVQNAFPKQRFVTEKETVATMKLLTNHTNVHVTMGLGSYATTSYYAAAMTLFVMDVAKVIDFTAEKSQCVQWFLNRRSNSTLNKWGHQVHRTAVSLYLADKNFFAPENRTGEEIKYELAIHLLSILNRRKVLKTEQLALYVHAMVVACLNPRDFYRHDLVSDLRKRVNHSKNTNPLAILVLCNAGADMTTEDVQRLNRTFYSQQIPYWTDTQVMSTMALSCIFLKTNVSMDKSMLSDWLFIMNSPQVGTVNNLRTTSLIIQVMLGIEDYIGFDWNNAVKVIEESSLLFSSNFLDKYYLIPVLSNKSPTLIDSSHCPELSYNADLFRKLQEKTITVYYSVWMETDDDFGRSWRLKVSPESSFFDVIAKVWSLDPSHLVEYNLVSGKPYVRSVSGIGDDPETDHYWFTYERTYESAEDPKRLEDSPKDIKTRDNQELILWYKNGVWNADGSGSEELP